MKDLNKNIVIDIKTVCDLISFTAMSVKELKNNSVQETFSYLDEHFPHTPKEIREHLKTIISLNHREK